MRDSLHGLLSGSKRGVLPALARLGLHAASLFYGLGVGMRNAAYNAGLLRARRAAIPVICLGNLTTGGTGKTPLAACVARFYRDRGVRVCFISRGYGAGESGMNDEALVLKQLCPDVAHLQNPDRVAAARVAREEQGSQLIVLDDGFQHRRIARDLDIVLIDAMNPWGHGHLLPRGLLREPVSALKRASLVVITRVDQVSREALDRIRCEIARFHPQGALVEVAFTPEHLINSSGQTMPLASVRDSDIAAFCGIGNPTAFLGTLERLGITVREFRSFPDHHLYSPTDLAELEVWVRALEINTVVCTQKDLVKIGRGRLGDRPLWAVQIGAQFVAGADVWNAKLGEVMRIVPPQITG